MKADAASLKNALRDVFSVNPFRAYEEVSGRVWRDEPVDVFMSELRRLARTADITVIECYCVHLSWGYRVLCHVN